MLPRGEKNRWHREGAYRQTDTHAKARDRDGVTIIQCKYKTFLYNWLTLWYTWNSHSTVNQLSFNNKTFFKSLRHRKLFLSLTRDYWFDHQSFHLGKSKLSLHYKITPHFSLPPAASNHHSSFCLCEFYYSGTSCKWNHTVLFHLA